MATQSEQLLNRLVEAGVDFVVVGGIAAVFHGSQIVTSDLDVCVRFDPPSCAAIMAALAPLEPRHRMRFSPDPQSIVGNRNLYVTCTLGVVDFLGEVTGVGDFEAIRAQAVAGRFGESSVRFMSLDQLLASKRAIGRPKDLRVARELELIRAKRRA